MTPDSSFAAQHVSTTSSIDLTSDSCVPTFSPVVQNPHFSDGDVCQKAQAEYLELVNSDDLGKLLTLHFIRRLTEGYR